MSLTRFSPGFWPSDFAAEDAVAGLTEYSQLASDGDYVYWVAYEPESGGRVGLYRCEPKGAPELVTPENVSVCTRVHEYGGRSWCLAEGGWVYVSGADQQIWYQSHERSGVKITHSLKGRFAAPVFDNTRKAIIAVLETHPIDKPVQNALVSISLPDGEIEILHEGLDFYDCPTISPDGRFLSWISWCHPEQPWTKTSLWQIDLVKKANSNPNDDSTPICLVEAQAALTQPSYTSDNSLMVLSDHQGYWHPYWVSSQGLETTHTQIEGDACAAPWQLGGKNYLQLSNTRWIFCEYFKGKGRLILSDAGQLTHLAAEYSYVKSPVVIGNEVFVAAASASQAYAIIAVDLISHNVRVVVQSKQSLPSQYCAEPRPLRVGNDSSNGGDDPSHAWLYLPQKALTLKGDLTSDQKRDQQESLDTPADPHPLVIFLHGGPTSASYPQYNPKIQYWVQRGFAVADLNYRGSTSFGRDYRYALKERWGEVDVEDIRNLVAAMTVLPDIDEGKIFIRGGSAGGFSALLALVSVPQLAGAASLYGVTDLAGLAQSTHKFESRYLDWLIGDFEKDAQVYRQRSPLYQTDQIKSPVLFLQGELDSVVPKAQTQAMVSALEAQGNHTESHYFANEHHGFRHPENQAKALRLELSFYQRIINTLSATDN